MLDIDKFKNINDTYGHPVGDDVIIALANVLKEFSRESDVACRFGGEEFLILLPETSVDGAVSIGEKIREHVQNLVIKFDGDKELSFTISVGVSEVNFEDEVNLEKTIHRSDDALYEAKESGRNRVCKA